MFQNAKLSTKIILGFSCPLLLMCCLVVGAYVSARSVRDGATLAREESVVFAQLPQTMRQDVIQVQQRLTDISATRDLDGLDDGFDEAQNSADSFKAGPVEFEKMFAAENDTKSLAEVKKLDAAFDEYYAAGRKMALAHRPNDNPKRRESNPEEAIPLDGDDMADF